jgi:hypothetical protein
MNALCNDLLAGLQIAMHLDEVVIGETGFDLAKIDRLVLVRDPEPDLVVVFFGNSAPWTYHSCNRRATTSQSRPACELKYHPNLTQS